MSLWGKYDAANSIPTFAKYGDPKYTNTNVYGVSVGEANTAGSGVAPGWVYVQTGTGGVLSITIYFEKIGRTGDSKQIKFERFGILENN